MRQAATGAGADRVSQGMRCAFGKMWDQVEVARTENHFSEIHTRTLSGRKGCSTQG